MQIRSLAIAKRPVWIDICKGQLQEITIKAKVRFWPAQAKGVALFVFDFEEEPAPEVLAEHGIGSSTVGPYVYLTAPSATAREVEQRITFPNATLKRIGIRLWNAQEPVVLDDIKIEARGAELYSEYEMAAAWALDDLQQYHSLPDFSKVLALNLMTSTVGCNGQCHAICQHWYGTMDDVARRYPDNGVGRTNCQLKVGSQEEVPVTLFHGQPAMLRIPATLAAYMRTVGDKGRNMVRKAQRQGYAYRKVDPDQYLDDVLAIRTSDPKRQGKSIPDYFKVRPTQIIADPFRNDCKLHREEFFGVFKDDRLIAYTTIFFYGELGQVNHILGHAEHLQEGVMNLLVSEMVREIIEDKPWVRAINYLYPYVGKTNGGLGLFKKNTGFFPEVVMVTQSGFELSAYFSALKGEAQTEQKEARKAPKVAASKALKQADLSNELIVLEKPVDRTHAVEVSLQRLRGGNAMLEVIRHRIGGQQILDPTFDQGQNHAIVFENMSLSLLEDFLSGSLKGFRTLIPKNSFLLFDFKRQLDQKRTGKSIFRFLPPLLQPRGWRVHQRLSKYFLKRFKSIDLSIDDVKRGFKGSDYVVAGLIDCENNGSYQNFDSLLILRKIR